MLKGFKDSGKRRNLENITAQEFVDASCDIRKLLRLREKLFLEFLVQYRINLDQFGLIFRALENNLVHSDRKELINSKRIDKWSKSRPEESIRIFHEELLP